MPWPATAGSRVALVLAAEDYTGLPKSPIGVSRARDIAGALEERGFEVIFTANPTNAGGRASLRDFSVKTAGADLAIAVLVGHGIATGGQTYFLPANTEIGRATDLMSRGLAVANIAQIVGRAKQGGVFFFMTLPAFPQPIEGLDTRPQYASDVLPNVVAAISNSPKIPLSRVDGAGAEAASAFAGALRTPGSSLADAARVASAGDLGFVVGTAAPSDLSAPAPAPVAEQPSGPSAADLARQAEVAARQAEAEAKLRAERLAREAAEKKAREEEGRVQVLQSETQKAQADNRKAQADLARAQAEAQKAQAEAQRAQAEAQKALAEAERTKAEAEKARRDALAEAQKAEQARRDALAEAERIRQEAASSAEQAKQEAVSSAEKARQEALAEAERVKTQAKALEDQAALARAEADRAKEAKEKAEADAAQKLAALATQAAQPQLPAPPPPPAVAPTVPSTPLDEGKLGQDQRRRIQEKLRDLGLYSGKVDGNLGPMTREAIGWYQKSRGVAETGFLTLDQYQALLAAD